MEKTVSWIICFITYLAAIASPPSINIGYVDGMQGSSYYGSASAAGEVSAAIYLPPGLLAKYSGCEISGARAMLYSRLNIESMRLWVRQELEDEDLCRGELTKSSTPALVKGWNEINFNSSYTIPDEPEKGLYIGVSYNQSGGSMGIASLGECTENAGFLKPVGENWSDRSSEFTFCIEAILSGDKLPKCNLRLDEVEFSPYYVTDKGIYKGSGRITNIGTERVSDFTITISSDCFNADYSKSYECALDYGQSYLFDFGIEGIITAEDGLHEITLTVTEVNGEGDADMENNSMSGNFRIVPFDMTKRVLVEEFTTERCSNCPRVAGWMHEILENPAYASLIVPVCHHSGYGTDNFTIPSDEEYTWFYDPMYQFAPALMIDRQPSANGAPPFNPASIAAIYEGVDGAAEIPAEVSISLHAEIKDNMLAIIVRGAKGVDELCENPRLVCVVTEDNVPAVFQAGLENGRDYLHQHVSRAVNATWGVEIPFDNDLYEYETLLPLDNVHDIKNINLAAYIFNYDPSSRKKCLVKNAALLPYSEMTTDASVELIETGYQEDAWYTLSGLRLSQRPEEKGLYISRKGNCIRKIIIP